MRFPVSPDGTTRIRQGFLLLPRWAYTEGSKEREWRWLERARWLEQKIGGHWNTDRWLNP